MKRWMKALAALALVGALTFAATGPGLQAANLSGGTYTYVVAGEEVFFQFDPISRKDGMLLPIEVFEYFKIEVSNPLTSTPALSRSGVKVTLTLGAKDIMVDDRPEMASTAPMRLSGRLFLPADVLKHFGVEFAQDGNYVALRNYSEPGILKELSPAEFSSLKSGRQITQATVKADSGTFLSAEFVILTPELLQTANLKMTYGARAQLMGMLKSNTLVLMKLSNYGLKAGAVTTTGNLFLADANRRQYDVLSTFDIGDGSIGAKLSPGADRSGVLVFPKLQQNPGTVQLFADQNGVPVGHFVAP